MPINITVSNYLVRGEAACPWCDGTGECARSSHTQKARCGWCTGTGKREEWERHAEYRRQEMARAATMIRGHQPDGGRDG